MPTTFGDAAVFPRSPASWGMGRNAAPFKEISQAWRTELAQRISAPETGVGQPAVSVACSVLDAVDETTTAPRNVDVGVTVRPAPSAFRTSWLFPLSRRLSWAPVVPDAESMKMPWAAVDVPLRA